MNGYELMVLFGPDEAKEAKIIKVKKIIEDAGGKVEDVSDWGVKDLAYPIKKFSKAQYLLFDCQLLPKSVLDVDKAVKISEDIIRYILVRKEIPKKSKGQRVKELEVKNKKEEVRKEVEKKVKGQN